MLYTYNVDVLEPEVNRAIAAKAYQKSIELKRLKTSLYSMGADIRKLNHNAVTRSFDAFGTDIQRQQRNLYNDFQAFNIRKYQHTLSRNVKGLGKLETGIVSESRILNTVQLNDLKAKLVRIIRENRSHGKDVIRRTRCYGGSFDVPKIGYTPVNAEPLSVLKAHKANLSRICFNSKRPLTDSHHVGIEIECIIPAYTNGAETDLVLAERFIASDLSQYVQLKRDGSIAYDDGDNERDLELCIVAPLSLYQDVLAKCCNALAEVGAVVNKSCGLHVHLDARNRNAETVLKRLIKAQTLLYQIVPKSRRTNTYCKKTNANTSVETQRDRYRAINGTAYRKYKTIEVRLHSGTVDFTKINNWIILLHLIIDSALTVQPRSISGWIRELGITGVLGEYIKARFEKFKDDNASDETVLPEPEEASDDDYNEDDCAQEDNCDCEQCQNVA